MKIMRLRARYNKRLDPITLAVVMGIVMGSVYFFLRILAPKSMAAGVAVFAGLILNCYLGGFFRGRAKRVYAGWLLIFLLFSFLVGYLIFVFDFD
jgi:hypothetical protein